MASLLEGDHSSTLTTFKLRLHYTITDELGEHSASEV